MANKKQSVNWRLLGSALIGLTSIAIANSPVNIDSLESAQTGVSFSGDLEAGALNSSLVKGDVDLGKNTSESVNYTEANLNIKVRPSFETEGGVTIRMHQDWNNYYDEGFNPLLPVWMYFKADLKKYGLKFRVGDVMVNHTPLTLQDYLPDGLMGEAKIFEEKRLNTMADKNINGVDRHMQGFDLAGDWGSDLGVGFRAIGSRLRTPWWNSAVIQYDNSSIVSLFGLGDIHVSYQDQVTLGATYSFVHQGARSARQYYSVKPYFLSEPAGRLLAPLSYESSTQKGGYLKVESPEESNILYSAHIEYQMSIYEAQRDTFTTAEVINEDEINYINYSGQQDAVSSLQNLRDYWTSTDVVFADSTTQQKGSALLVKASGGYKLDDIKSKLNFGYRIIDSSYVADLAQSNSFNNNAPILNSRNAMKSAGNTSVLEGLYQSVYTVRPVTAQSNLETNNPLDPETYNGTNNNFLAPYEKTNWTNQPTTASERAMQANGNLLQMVSGNGEATADRVGLDVGLTSESEEMGFDIEVNYSAYKTQRKVGMNNSEQEFSRMAFGAAFDAGKLLDMGSEYSISLGYTALEAKNMVKGAMVNAGANIDLIYGLSLLGGFQMYDAESLIKTLDGVPDYVAPKFSESQYAAGLRYQIAEGASLDAQYAMLSNTVNDKKQYDMVMPSLLLRVAF